MMHFRPARKRYIWRSVLAPVRCLVQVVLALYGLILAVLAMAGATIVVGYYPAAIAMRASADLGRRLAARWGGVDIPIPPREAPPEPERRDGLFVYNNSLFKSRGFPAFMIRLEWLGRDGVLTRDWKWLLLTPFSAAIPTAVPPALLGAAVWLVATGTFAIAAPVLVVAAFAFGPAALSAHAHVSRALLGPAGETWWHRSGLAGWIARQVNAAWAGAALASFALVGFALGVISMPVIAWSGGWATPWIAMLSRPWIGHYRRRTRQWAGTELPDPYRPMPAPPAAEADGLYRAGRTLYKTETAAVNAQRYLWMLRDPATWRDLAWMLTAVPLAVISLIPAVLVGFGFFGLVWQPAWWTPWAVPIGLTTGEWVTPWYVWEGIGLLWPSAAAVPGWVSVPIGLGLTLIGMLLARPLLRLRARLDRPLLAPTRSTVLAQRVQRLVETRADALDAEAAELRRIERDLHDGAQARLVAVGLSLATVEQLMDSDPQAARALLAQARESSVTAVQELRQLVRGINPPVLAERGLGDAVRAIALDSPVPVAVSVSLPRRLPAPLESAAYFAVCEGIANAARHGAPSRIEVDLRDDGSVLHIRVADDGRGGADPARGSGLAGVGRRLGTFDGTLVVTSPPGGPTQLTMEIPCAR